MAKEKNIKIYLDKDFEKYMQQLIKKEWKMKEESKKIFLLIFKFNYII